jgi:DTW domain-containing protein
VIAPPVVPYPPYLPPPGGRARGRRLRRCDSCALGEALCVCAELPRLKARTRIVLIVHHDELHKPSSSGRLVANVLSNSDVIVRGSPSGRDTEVRLPEGGACVLFPSAAAELLTAAAPCTLVGPEGTWGQASRVTRRVPELAKLRRVRLPQGEPPRFALRASPRPDALSTAEAVTRALTILDDAAAAAGLEAAHALWYGRALIAKEGRA